MNYVLHVHQPYEAPVEIFTGSHEDLLAFIRRRAGTGTYQLLSGRKIKYRTIAGYDIQDITVYFEGPDIADLVAQAGVGKP